MNRAAQQREAQMDQERLIGPRDVSALYDLPLTWVYAKAEAGVLPHFKIGKYIKFRPSEIVTWLEGQRAQQPRLSHSRSTP